jgi:hypothetical protein
VQQHQLLKMCRSGDSEMLHSPYVTPISIVHELNGPRYEKTKQ